MRPTVELARWHLGAIEHGTEQQERVATWVYGELVEATETATVRLTPDSAACTKAYRKTLETRLDEIKDRLVKNPELVTTE